MKNTARLLAFATALAILGRTGPAAAQSTPGWGRFSLFGMTQDVKYDDGSSRTFNELSGYLTVRSASADNGGLEYAIDTRGSVYPGTDGRNSQMSIWDAWVGARTPGGAFTFHAGQMYLVDLGGLGQVGGLLAEFRLPGTTPAGRLKFSLFGGLDPKNWDVGFASHVWKGGGFVTLEGDQNRRHVLGYVLLRDSSLTERSVLTTTNFVPIGKQFFVYQTAEYDLTGPGGVGGGSLNFFFANARYTPSSRVELMATYHRGRSIDTRTITQDMLAGRPIDQKSLDGFLYESVGGRMTVEVVRNVRLYAGYARDRNNYEDATSGRITAGLWTTNILGSGFDFSLSDNRVDKSTGGNGSYDAWYASLGHTIGPKVYLSLDYSTSLSTVQFTDSLGVTIVNRPKSKRWAVNGNWNIDRHFSLFVTGEELRDDTSKDLRGILGLNYNFKLK